MAHLYLLSDPHLGKDMTRFGDIWIDHVEKIQVNWDSVVRQHDMVCVPGDVSWAKTGDEAARHLQWLHERPGRYKIIVRGNHDWWWQSTAKVRESLPMSIVALDGDARLLDGIIFAGAKGYLSPNDPYFDSEEENAYKRNFKLAERALAEALALRIANPMAPVIFCLHYPPFTSDGAETEFSRMLEKSGIVAHCVFGHFHFENEWKVCPTGLRNGVRYALGSCDFLQFVPTRLMEYERPRH